MNQADRDEIAGVTWMRALPRTAHAAIPLAVDGGQHVFQASCPCGWKGPIHRRERGVPIRFGLNTRLWLAAAADADAHNAMYAATRRAS